MAYKYRDKPTEQPIEQQPIEQQPVEQNSSKPTEMEELRKEIAELKALVEKLSENGAKEKHVEHDLEAWVDNIGEHLTKELLGAVSPEIAKQKKALQDLEIQANAMKEKYTKFFRKEGFKRVLYWISVVCNIGLAGYLIYTLIDWSAIVL